MKKDKKVTAVQIAPFRRENPAKTLKKLNLDTNPEWTITFYPHMGGFIYSGKTGDNNGKNNK